MVELFRSCRKFGLCYVKTLWFDNIVVVEVNWNVGKSDSWGHFERDCYRWFILLRVKDVSLDAEVWRVLRGVAILSMWISSVMRCLMIAVKNEFKAVSNPAFLKGESYFSVREVKFD